MSRLSITLQQQDPPHGVVALHGEHDAYSSGRLENELALLLDGGFGVVVDLSDTTFIDSQTLSVLLGTRHRAEEADLGFTVVLPDDGPDQVHRLLDVTGLRATFAVFESQRAASAAARAGATGRGRVHTGP
jgi:anti-sigma B factor antagonist